jgi:hypothetical protein
MNPRNIQVVQDNSQESPVVYQGTQQGQITTRILGKRPKPTFGDAWNRFLTLPNNFLHLALDAVLWTFSSSIAISLIKIVPSLGLVLLLPFSALLLGLILACSYSSAVRPMAFIRLGLLILGIVLSM